MTRRARALAALLVIALSGCSGTSGPPPVTAAMAGTAHSDAQTLSAGRKVFVNRCIECHVLPSINDHPAGAWPALVSKMSARADLTPAEHEELISYILAAHSQPR